MAAIPTLGRTQGLRPKYARPWTQFDEPTEYELNLALSRMLNSPQRFDAVIVDEGHEFKKEWWDLVEGCLSDVHSGRLVIFYDDNQAIYRFSVQPSTQLGPQRYADLALAPIVLARDCRNGGDAFNLIQQLHPKSPMMQRFAVRARRCKRMGIHFGGRAFQANPPGNCSGRASLQQAERLCRAQRRECDRPAKQVERRDLRGALVELIRRAWTGELAERSHAIFAPVRIDPGPAQPRDPFQTAMTYAK